MKSFSSFVARRYIKTNQDNRFFSWIAILSILGVALGVAAIIVVLSVVDGFKSELRNLYLHANAHVLAYRYPAGMLEPDRWAEVISRDFPGKTTGVSPFIHLETMVKHGSIMHSVLVRGIHPVKREKVQSIRHLIRPQEAMDQLQDEIDGKANKDELPGVIIGVGLQRIIHVEVGDHIQLISPSREDFSDIRSFRVAGIYDSGLKYYDDRLIAMSLTTAQDFFDMPERVTGIEIGLIKPEESVQIADDMGSRYAFSVREWQSYNIGLFEAIERDRGLIFLIVVLTIVVASFNILTTMFVAVSQKQKDISLLKALGASNTQILMTFLKQGTYLGAIGGVLGCFLGVGICLLLQNYEFVELPDQYHLTRLPVHYDPMVYASTAFLGMFMSMVAGLYPALVASRLPISHGIAGEGPN